MTKALRFRHLLALGLLGAMLAWPLAGARAQHADARNTSLEVNPFHLNVSGYGILSTGSGEILDHLEVRGGLTGQYLTRPLVVDPADGSADRPLVDWRAQVDVAAAVGLFDRLEVGLILPVTVAQEAQLPGFGLGPVPDAGMGNASVYAMANILSQQHGGPMGLAVGAPLTLPTSTADAYLGADGIGVAPQVRLSRTLGPIKLAANVEVLIQARESLNNLQEDDRLTYRGGAMFAPSADWGVGVEYIGSTLLASPWSNPRASRGEVVVGGRFRPVRWLDLRLAAGRGVDRGIGAPSFRAVLGAALHFNRPPEPGQEEQADDPCAPNAQGEYPDVTPEDCPESDFDDDGVANAQDQCPDEAEDADGFRDDDGCPDNDNDGDGIADASDSCPNAGEDVDAFADGDGCPDPDNDGDGLTDAEDDCSAKAEDFDGFEDADGCPDSDNDGDGLADRRDHCPFGAGDPNGNGCPAEAPPEAKVTAEEIELSEKIYFVTDRAVIRRRSYDALQKVAEALKTHPQIQKVEIRGYADKRGRSEYNYHLSWERAKVIRLYLIRKAGIDPARVKATGYGEVGSEVGGTAAGDANGAADADEQDFAEARRVEFKILRRAE